MQPSPDNSFTVAQLSVALGVSKQTVLNDLAGTPPSVTRIVRGNEARAWTLAALPEAINARFRAKAVELGYEWQTYRDSCLSCTAAGLRVWQPDIPLAELADASIAEAHKLRDALLPALQRKDDLRFSDAEHVRLGLEEYRRAFGHAVSERHWHRLFDRTLRRDAGAEDWQRLEIYLPDRLACKSASAYVLPAEHRFARLLEFLKGFANPSAPTRAEIAALWAEAFECYEAEAATPGEQRAVRRELLAFLRRHAPWLADSRNALRVAFERKFSRWIAGNRNAAVLLNGREEKRGVPTAPPIPQADIDLLAATAAFKCGGRIAQAKRELVAQGERSGLTKQGLELLAGRGSRKSYVNRRILNQVAPDVKAIMPYELGKKAIDDATAHIERDYSKLVSMQVVNADDFTLPVYFYVPDGLGWYTLTRGQCLLMLDVRSWKIVAYSLQPERNYNSLVIRTLMNRVCSAWGIPGVWYFERGIWQNALLVKGEAPAGWQPSLSWTEAKVGWERLGVRFLHAIRARSKPVERVGGLLQDLMHGVRGYCGRNERVDLPADTKRAMDDLKFKRVAHPGELFLSFDEWNEQLRGLIERYNANSQDGEILQGLSPDEAFEKCWPHDNPPARLDANSWHLVSHYSRPVPVTANGITFRIGNRKFNYRNERTGQDRGQTVLAWFDPECPEFLCVTDLNRKHPYLVERSAKVDFLAEPGDLALECELSKAAAHSSYPRTRYHTLKAKFAPTFRRNLVDVATAETAQEISRQRETLAAEQKQASVRIAKARKQATTLGIRPTLVEDSPRAAEAIDLMAEARLEHERQKLSAAKTEVP